MNTPVPQILDARKGSEGLGIPLGALVVPAAPADRVVQRAPVTCASCGGVACPGAAVEAGGRSWGCGLCGRRNPVSDDAVLRLGSVETWPELTAPPGTATDYLSPPLPTPGLGPAPPSRAVVLVVDAAPGRAAAAALRRELAAALEAAPPSLRVGIVLAGRAVCVVHTAGALAAPGSVTPSAAALPGAAEPAAHLLEPLVEGALAPLGGAGSRAAAAAVACLRDEGGTLPPPARPRCLGTAVAVAIALLDADARKGVDGGGGGPPTGQIMARGDGGCVGHIVVVAAGPPTRGLCAVAPADVGDASRPADADVLPRDAARAADALSYRARSRGIVLDAFALGPGGAEAAPLLGRLALGAGGRLCLHGGGAGSPADGVGPRVAACLSSCIGGPGNVQLRTSALFLPSLAAPLPSDDLDGASRADASARRSAVSAGAGYASCPLPAPRSGDGAAFWIDVRAPPAGRRGVVQAVAAWPDGATGGLLTRVASAAVCATSHAPSALAAVDGEAAGLFLAQRAAADALERGATAGACDAAAAGFAKAVRAAAAAGRDRAGRRGWLGGSSWRLPPPLTPMAAFLYHAARSPAFASRHAGERARALALAARGDSGVAARSLCPRLHVLDREGGGRFDVVPAVDLALMPDTVAVLDCGDALFAWLGRDAAVGAAGADGWSPERCAAAATAHAAALAAGRSPSPETTIVMQGSAGAGAVAARLAPLHHDDAAEQEALLPSLSRLAPRTRAALAAAAPATDEPSLVEWCREAGVELALGGGGGGGGGGSGGGAAALPPLDRPPLSPRVHLSAAGAASAV